MVAVYTKAAKSSATESFFNAGISGLVGGQLVVGINPEEVFEALTKESAALQQEAYLTKAEVKRYHREKWKPKRANRAGQQSTAETTAD